MCSLKKLKLDLPNLIYGPEFIQQRQRGGSLQKKDSARYCDTFPSLEMEVSVSLPGCKWFLLGNLLGNNLEQGSSTGELGCKSG